MSPRWLHWPSSSSSVIYSLSGTMDATFGTGSKDNNPNSSPTFPFWGSGYFIGIRKDSAPASLGIVFDFGGTTGLNSFTSAHSPGSLDIVFTWTSGTRSGSSATATSATYYTTGDRLWISDTQFSSWSSIAPSTSDTGNSESYTLIIQ